MRLTLFQKKIVSGHARLIFATLLLCYGGLSKPVLKCVGLHTLQFLVLRGEVAT